ncbi:hypothetical protein BTR23_00045 [Alkalihalophilus pseudofirmus]|nr:hypothetical protein BTR23_00045 [Alkalihalophilus pseudofirmus]
MNRLVVTDLQIHRKHEENRVVDGVSFQLNPGKVTGLLGESGSGKTTISLALMGLLASHFRVDGSIRYKAKELLSASKKDMRKIRGKDLALIMQNPMVAYDPISSIGSQMVETIITHLKVSRKEAKELALYALKDVGLHEAQQVFAKYPFQLSGGMLQRVMIANTIVLKPSFVIADEPTTALDTVNQKSVLLELEKLVVKHNTGVLLVTHDLGVLYHFADEVVVLQKGRVVEHAAKPHLFKYPQHPYTKQILDANMKLRGVYL